MSSLNMCRSKSPCPNCVTNNELFDLIPNLRIAHDGNRDELPIDYNYVADSNVSEEDDRVRVSGYVTRSNYNHLREIRETLARHRRVSKIFPM